MNKRDCNINVSNSNLDKAEIPESKSVLLEKELKEIYNTQYNDLFPKILTKTKSDFISLLKSQVALHLKIINKIVSNPLNEKYIGIFSQKFFADKAKTTKGLEDILKNTETQKNNLQLVNCYIHCHKCSKIVHECKNKLILYKGYIYCICCQKVYNENQIKLFCEECKTCYYSKIRYVINKKYENFYNVCFKKYHCNIDEPEKIKCLECGHDLYYNITYDEKNLKKNSISEIFCLKCKLLYDLDEVFFQCKICKKNFQSEAKLYNNFSFLKNQFLLIMHTLRKKNMAMPERRIARKCKCDISKYDKYLHEEDNGILYLGHNLKGDYIILCDSCYSIFNYNDFIWTCPVCNVNFKSKKNLYKKHYINTTNYFGEKITKKIEKCPTMFQSPSNFGVIFKKKIIEPVPSSAGDKGNNINIVKQLFTKKSEPFEREEKQCRNRNKFNHTTKIIMLTTNKKSKINNNNINNLNLSETKMDLFKKIKNISLKNNNNYHTTVNSITKENNIKKSGLKSFIKNKNYTNNNTISSAINSINNKSDCNTNKCNDSTNITSNNLECNKETNNNKNDPKKISSNNLESEFNDNKSINKINRKLIYNDFSEIEKKPQKNSIVKIQIQKNNEKINSNIPDKEIKNEKIQTTSNKEKIYIKYIVGRKDIKSRRVNVNSINNLNSSKEKDNVLLKSVENSHIINSRMNSFFNKKKDNYNTKINNNNNNKIKSIKSMRNIRGNNNNLKIINLKSANYIKINNNNQQNKQPAKTSQNSKNKMKLVKSVRNIKEIIKVNYIIERNNKLKITKEKKQISKCPTQIKMQIKKNNDIKKNENSIFKKIKEYYEEGFNDKENKIEEQSKEKNNNIIKMNKSLSLKEKNKIKFITDFNSENYSILKLLGKGTYGKTFLVEDPKTKLRFALKKITINDKTELKENKEEYNLILKLTKDFPDLKIINIYGIETKNLDKYTTVMYVLMEAAKYDWEKEIMNHYKNLSYYKEEHLTKILYDLVKSFSILQKNGICHRDVKPQNILCFENDEYKISDFGEAKNLKNDEANNGKLKKDHIKFNIEDNTVEQTLRGTELYMSPILFQALRARAYQNVTYNPYKSDVFSLGMCFFLASSLSYEGLYEVREIIKNKDKTRLVINRYLSMKYSQKYINILINMLQINEKDRPDFIELEKILDNLYI